MAERLASMEPLEALRMVRLVICLHEDLGVSIGGVWELIEKFAAFVNERRGWK